MDRLLTSAFAFAAVAAVASSASATSIANGSFKSGPAAPNGYFIELGNSSTAIPGWTVGGNSIDYINPSNPYWVAEDGHRALDLSGSAPGSVFQTLSTTVGQAYTVSFYMAGNPDGDPVIKHLSVDINGSGAQTYAFDTTGVTYSAMGWTKETYKFTATSTSSVLTFTDLTPGSPYGAALDNVSISAPEPATWALMLVAMAGIGGVARARRSRLAAA